MHPQLETPYVKMWLEDSILHMIYAEGIEVDRKIAQHIVESRIQFVAKKSYSCLIDMRGIKSVTPEARKYLANEGAQYVLSCGLITGNPFTRALAHIFLTVDKPKVPIRLFGDVASAKKWLSRFVLDTGSSPPLG